MKLILPLITFLGLACSFAIQPLRLVSHPPSLGFYNFTGKGVPKDMINQFINFVNAASGFFKNDIPANLKYIKENMDRLYGDDQKSFFIFIQNQQDNGSTRYTLWGDLQDCIASFSNINIIYPTWSYLFAKVYDHPHVPFFAYLKNNTVGKGLSSEQIATIHKTISQYEPKIRTCICEDSTGKIMNALTNIYNQQWNAICDATGSVSGYISTLNDRWGTFAGLNCYYTLYVH